MRGTGGGSMTKRNRNIKGEGRRKKDKKVEEASENERV